MMDHLYTELSLAEAVPGTSAGILSMAAVPDVFDPKDVADVDVLVVI